MAEASGAVYELLKEVEQSLFDQDVGRHSLPKVPCPATFRIVAISGNVRLHEEPVPAEVRSLQDGILCFRCHSDSPRGHEVELDALAAHTAEGEHHLIGRVLVRKTTRISDGYEFECEVRTLRTRTICTPWIFARFVASGDTVGWNRWMSDIEDGPVLHKLNLQKAKLTNFDLCCADLTGSDLREADLRNANLAGANLTDCQLDGVRVTGTDLFAARIPYPYRGMLPASGLVEIESVTLIDKPRGQL